MENPRKRADGPLTASDGVIQLRRDWDVTFIPIQEIYARVKLGGWEIIRTRVTNDFRVYMDLKRLKR